MTFTGVGFSVAQDTKARLIHRNSFLKTSLTRETRNVTVSVFFAFSDKGKDATKKAKVGVFRVIDAKESSEITLG